MFISTADDSPGKILPMGAPKTDTDMHDLIPILGLTADQLARIFQERLGKSPRHAATVFREFYKKDGGRFEDPAALGLPHDLAREIGKILILESPNVEACRVEDGVVKFVTRLADGCRIESVVIPMATHGTLCVSSQVGCRMGCVFCETGRMGFVRDLTAAEIVGQLYTARMILGHDIRNVVFMGMGEPLDNPDNVIQAVRVLNDDRGFAIAHRHMTLSTAGLVDGIQRIARLSWPNLCLAVSLNAPNDRIRSRIMPVNRRYGMAGLREALLAYPLKKNGTFFVEYVLIKGVNDAREHARELSTFLKPLKVRLNLIALNSGADPSLSAPDTAGVLRFRDWLVAEKVFVRLRSPRGRSLTAGCGQLGGTLARRASMTGAEMKSP